MSGSSLNLKQVIGGAAIKQGDTNTRLGYELLDKSSGPMYSDIMSEIDNVSIKVILTELKAKTSIIITDATIKNGTVIFTMPAETTPGRYDVEIAISVKGQTAVFPSTYASVTLEIVKSYLMANPADSEVKYINIGSLPSASDVAKIQSQLNKLQEEIKKVGTGGSADQSKDISRIDSELKAIQTTVKGLPTKEAVDDSIRTLKEDIKTKATKEELSTQSEEIKAAQSKIQANALSISKANESFQNTAKQMDGLYNKISSMATKEDLDGKLETSDLEPINASITKLEGDISSKADRSVIEGLQASITEAQNTAATKASATSVSALQSKVERLDTALPTLVRKDDISTIDTSIADIKDQISKLPTQADISDKATIESVNAITTKLSDLNTKVEAFKAGMSEEEKKELDNKLSAISELKETVASIKDDISKKADTTSLDPINAKLESIETSKANKEDLKTKLEATSLEPINASIKSLETNMESKASKEDAATIVQKTLNDSKLPEKVGALISGMTKKTQQIKDINTQIKDIKTKLESNTGGMSEDEKQELNTKLESLESRVGKIKNKNPNGKDISMWLGTEEELSALKEEDLNDNSTIYIRS